MNFEHLRHRRAVSLRELWSLRLLYPEAQSVGQRDFWLFTSKRILTAYRVPDVKQLLHKHLSRE